MIVRFKIKHNAIKVSGNKSLFVLSLPKKNSYRIQIHPIRLWYIFLRVQSKKDLYARVTVDCGEASNISLDYAGSFSPQTDWLCFVRTIVHRVLCSQCSLSVFCKLSLNNTITWQLAAQSHYLHLKHSIQIHVYLIKESLNFPNLCSVIDKYLNQANVIRRTTSSHFVK